MNRRLYRWLVILHPPQFRRQFGEEFLCIFDEAGAGAARALLADAVISVLRQWALRSEFPLIAMALPGAAVQMILGGFVWLGLIHRMAAGKLAPWGGAQTPQQAGMLLLLIAGLLTALMLGATVLAVWCIRFCARKGSSRPVRMVRGAGVMARVLLITLAVTICLWIAPVTRAQSPAARPQFEVASVRLNTTGCANGHGGGGSGPTPGRLSVRCIALRDLIQAAYGTFANGPNMDRRLLQVLGAPGWVESDNYDVEAKPAGNATIDQIYGPMLQGLLEDRFKLKIHRETRELAVYALTIAKNGPRLRASKEGSCTPLDLSHLSAQPAPGEPALVFCGRTSFRRNGEKMSVDAFGLSMATFAGKTLSTGLDLDRPVIDKTGLTGIFDIHLEFAADNSAFGPGSAGADSPAISTPSLDSGPSIFTALQEQLGLKLSPDKGAVDVLVVEHIERPSPN